ncbi:MAG: DUF4860 domain-containing protein [Lachnospiraceae bacterium]|nr:DUF4860 domain-containing protein [Lachnospiraceae bacterium]
MGVRLKRRHMIDLLFPVALFFVFALSAVTLILLAAGIYRSTTENSSLQYTSRSSLAYLSEKIHQCDENGGVYMGTLDGYDALILEQTYGDAVYHTYIYACEEDLKELFIKDGVEAEAKNGRTILEVKDFTLEQISDQLFRFTCTDTEDRTSVAVMGVRSRR